MYTSIPYAGNFFSSRACDDIRVRVWLTNNIRYEGKGHYPPLGYCGHQSHHTHAHPYLNNYLSCSLTATHWGLQTLKKSTFNRMAMFGSCKSMFSNMRV